MRTYLRIILLVTWQSQFWTLGWMNQLLIKTIGILITDYQTKSWSQLKETSSLARNLSFLEICSYQITKTLSGLIGLRRICEDCSLLNSWIQGSTNWKIPPQEWIKTASLWKLSSYSSKTRNKLWYRNLQGVSQESLEEAPNKLFDHRFLN